MDPRLPANEDTAKSDRVVRVEKEGYEPWETTLELAAGAEETVRATLQRRRPQPGEAFRDCNACPEMVVIPAGSFRMGSPAGEQGRSGDEGPIHRVGIAEPFALGMREVTVGEFRSFVQATGYRTEAERSGGCFWYSETGWQKNAERDWRSPGFAQEDDDPVACVSWNDAKAYVDWLSKQTGHDYRLPSEAEWELAARAGTTTARFWGDNPDSACRYANVADRTAKTRYPDWSIHDCEDGYVHTAPTGSFKANNFGLKDMLGNLWEWTADCWNGSYEGAPSDGSAWTGGDCGRRVLRGGSWNEKPEDVRSASRGRGNAEYRGSNVGFRPARTL